MDFEDSLSSHNLPFLEALYEAYERDPSSVDPRWHEILERERARAVGDAVMPMPRTPSGPVSADAEQIALQANVDKLIAAYRLHGHLGAKIDPLGRDRESRPGLDPAYFGLDESHMNRQFDPGTLFPGPMVRLSDILGRLRRTYTRHIGVEYWHLTDLDQRNWLRERMEASENEVVPPLQEQRRLLRSLARVDSVDKFLHSKFIGAKRFSISGGESVIALLETLIEDAGELGINEVVFGMAHRGRLNVLMNILGKTPADIFSEFESGDPWANLGSGDVKYHKGSFRFHRTSTGKEMYLALAFNPSHLEAITPVLGGRVRAKQDYLGEGSEDLVMGVTIHGDAAVMGQGVYAETLNLSQLDGYRSGGTIRVVINNQVGFTTNPGDSRSTVYCTAVADMLGVPIFHVNGDDPEAAAYAAKLAVAFRQQFKTDVIIDLVCYRRFGHNEGDEPTFTQPEMYRRIGGHPSVRDQYQSRLIQRETVSDTDARVMDEELRKEFEDALSQVREEGAQKGPEPMHGVWENYAGGPEADVKDVPTALKQTAIDAVRQAVTAVPEGFNLHRKVARLVSESETMLSGRAPLNWANAEYLAYGSLLLAGHDVRISGQDSIRGTFGHRHVGWTDTETERQYFPLQNIRAGQARFNVHNSPLSEFAVLGFEFGYSLAAPHALNIWEAQFGDFANGAQVIIDQFISSSEDKWNRISGLVLFLPHGYEGQGPEHSSARLERFLQLCAEDNMQVCNLTTPAQLFHVLRRQVLRKWRKPLVIMTPKSLLRYKPSFSPLAHFADGEFHKIIPSARDPKKVRRAMLSAGKVYYDLRDAREQRDADDVALVRIEQLYPFPEQAVSEALASYLELEEVVWVQEEPKNMGAWTFVRPYLEEILKGRVPLRFVGRESSASPATGSPESHKLETELMMEGAFGSASKRG